MIGVVAARQACPVAAAHVSDRVRGVGSANPLTWCAPRLRKAIFSSGSIERPRVQNRPAGTVMSRASHSVGAPMS